MTEKNKIQPSESFSDFQIQLNENLENAISRLRSDLPSSEEFMKLREDLENLKEDINTEVYSRIGDCQIKLEQDVKRMYRGYRDMSVMVTVCLLLLFGVSFHLYVKNFLKRNFVEPEKISEFLSKSEKNERVLETLKKEIFFGEVELGQTEKKVKIKNKDGKDLNLFDIQKTLFEHLEVEMGRINKRIGKLQLTEVESTRKIDDLKKFETLKLEVLRRLKTHFEVLKTKKEETESEVIRDKDPEYSSLVQVLEALKKLP